jgi:hypothetical protein
MEATIVSIYSLNAAFAKKPSSKSDIVVLVPETIATNKESIYKLDMLGVRVIRVSTKLYHYSKTYRLKFDTQTSFPLEQDCQLMINLWALLDYEKVIYFSPDVMFKNVSLNIITMLKLCHRALYSNPAFSVLIFVIERRSVNGYSGSRRCNNKRK